MAGAILALLRAFVVPRRLGVVAGADGLVRLFPSLIRGPDVAFATWGRIRGSDVSRRQIPTLAPELVIEVLSPSNTPAEMERKRREYFDAGVRLAWYIDPSDRTAVVHRADGTSARLTESDTLEGEDVLPGFALPLRELFAELDELMQG